MRNKYKRIFEENLSGFELSGEDQCLAFCPFHDDEGSKHKGFSANLETGLWYCFSCEIGGNINKFVDLTGVDFEDKEDLREIKTEVSALIERNVESDYGEVEWPESFEFITGNETSIIRMRGLKYLTENRGLSIEKILEYRLGYCTEGSFADRVIIPVFGKDGKLLYYVGRSIADNPAVPYKNASKKICGVGGNQVLFNFDKAWDQPSIVLCEGVFDAIAVGVNSVSLLGRTVSQEQLNLLRRTEAEKLFIALDGDVRRDALRLCKKLMQLGGRIYLVDIPSGEDPDSLNRAELAKLILTAREFSFVEEVENILGR